MPALPNAAAAKSPIRAEAVGQPVVVASRALKYGEKLDAGMVMGTRTTKQMVEQGGGGHARLGREDPAR